MRRRRRGGDDDLHVAWHQCSALDGGGGGGEAMALRMCLLRSNTFCFVLFKDLHLIKSVFYFLITCFSPISSIRVSSLLDACVIFLFVPALSIIAFLLLLLKHLPYYQL